MSASLSMACLGAPDVVALGTSFSATPLGSSATGVLSDGSSCAWGVYQLTSPVFDWADAEACFALSFVFVLTLWVTAYGAGRVIQALRAG